MSTPRLLSNRYELGETLGYGGMSEVHKGRDVRLGRDVAIKVLRADLARDSQFQERFRREAQNSAALNHPAIVAVYDTGETQTEYGPLPYIVMEFVDGRTLRDIVKTQGPLSGKRAMEVMADVSAALDFSHRHGIVHRDVKPANVMITKSGAVKVMDFGIARALHDGQAAVTQTAAVIGTAQYLSPEQARGESVDARSDVYAAGCVLFELLTGEPPFTGDSPVAVAYQHVREDPKAPSQLNPKVSPQLDAIVLKAMSKGPANRYQSAAEMRGDLVRVLSGQRPSAPAVMTAEDRTAVMNEQAAARPARTQVVSGGRHRPAALRSEPDDDYDPIADEEEERRARRKKAIMVTLVVILCVAVLGLAAWITKNVMDQGSAATEKASVPSVIGLSALEAKEKITKAGLVPAQESVPCEPGPAGAAPKCTADQINKVIGTDPAEGTSLTKGTKVTISVGALPGEGVVPDLKGRTAAEAQQILDKDPNGFKLAQGESIEVDDASKANKVAAQTPDVGVKQKKGSTITIQLGKAPDRVNVPSVLGDDEADARQTLEGSGFKVVITPVDSAKPEGTVLTQNPQANSKVDKGSTVTLTVSKGNQIEMPDLVGLTQEQAEQKLRALGWNGSFNVEKVSNSDPSKRDKVLTQQIAKGTAITRGTAVNVTVAQLGIGGS
ncbi:serine/threonine protein kinase [Lentzea albidocapillata subsp. violacea]|uniref:non-specific serine/threonine protein kinase n=1 Tax=Lentzea albidocapillata subsp. violacea TaxID=128104 RepID=A0A1G9DBK1_9PSEU|nr:Stk1 family PASTA domain-containing Ser/Thr kinase [Lentzea albidocapillata]SDK61207.1 serine/threonine protein kinase [Lentzea albidocapillata subsp. violacea]